MPVGQRRLQAVHGLHGAAHGQEDVQQHSLVQAEGVLLQVRHQCVLAVVQEHKRSGWGAASLTHKRRLVQAHNIWAPLQLLQCGHFGFHVTGSLWVSPAVRRGNAGG